MNLTKKAHQIIDEYYANKKIRVAIDATCGNGNDSLFLASRAEKLFCFDIQASAIRNTKAQLHSATLDTTNLAVSYILDSHSNLQKHCGKHAGTVDVIMFNLGYLPKSDDIEITTQTSSTIAAIEQAIQCSSKTGLISVLCYRGHAGGSEEYQALRKLLNSIDQHGWHWQQFDSFNSNESTPVLLVLTRTLVQPLAT